MRSTRCRPATTATDHFSYTVTDGHGLTSTATVTVTVTGIADGITVNAGNGNDIVNGTGGEDTLSGGNGNDIVYGPRRPRLALRRQRQ